MAGEQSDSVLQHDSEKSHLLNELNKKVSLKEFTPAPLDLEKNATKLELVLDLADNLPNKYEQKSEL